MFGLRLIAPDGDRLDLLDQLVPVRRTALGSGDQVEDHQREDVAAAQLPAEDVRGPAAAGLPDGVRGTRGLARGGTGGFGLAGGLAPVFSGCDAMTSGHSRVATERRRRTVQRPRQGAPRR